MYRLVIGRVVDMPRRGRVLDIKSVVEKMKLAAMLDVQQPSLPPVYVNYVIIQISEITEITLRSFPFIPMEDHVVIIASYIVLMHHHEAHCMYLCIQDTGIIYLCYACKHQQRDDAGWCRESTALTALEKET